MLLVKKLPCAVRWVHVDAPIAALLPTKCGGRVEADHAGRRGIKQKAADNTTIPACTNHHGERGDFTGAFKNFKQADMRLWLLAAIEQTQQEVAWMRANKR